jgi:RNase adapter protein RapZ
MSQVDTAVPAAAAGESREFVLLTGMSGAGRSTAADVLEDRGWYVVDNLPPQMLVPLLELARARDDHRRVAAVVDVRSRDLGMDLQGAVRELTEAGWHPRIVFVDATDEALVRRFEAVRRPHPLQGDGLLLDGITRERQLLGDIRSRADIVVDTTGYNVHQLSARVDELLNADDRIQLRVAVMSFGFKYGIPLDADVVLDMRFLPNPYWDLELRPYNGRDEQVRDYVLRQPGAHEYLDTVVRMLQIAMRGYLTEGRRHLTVALGCTGGKHRSVAAVEELVRRLGEPEGVQIAAFHRDLGRE